MASRLREIAVVVCGSLLRTRPVRLEVTVVRMNRMAEVDSLRLTDVWNRRGSFDVYNLFGISF